jgi:dipeptidyl aminopeptidase/acylaminoacyl peptidase
MVRSTFVSALAAGLLISATPGVRAAAMPSEAAPAVSPDCRNLLSPEWHGQPASRGITADDLLRLRDLGPRWRPNTDVFIGLSPDGKSLAFMLIRADPAANAECRALVTIGLAPGSRPRILDQGGQPVYELVDIRGLVIDYGYPALNRPRWSPDGRRIAYLRRDGGVTRLWVVGADGGDARPVAQAPIDIDTFAWSPDSSTLIYGARESFIAAKAGIAREGLSGYLYDARTVTYNSVAPSLAVPLPWTYHAVDLATGRVRPASAEEQTLAAPPPPADSASFPLRNAGSSQGWRAWTEQDDPSRWLSPVRLWAADDHGHRLACPDPVCVGTELDTLAGLWWENDGRTLLLMRRIGSQSMLFTWQPGAPHVRRIFATEDLLVGCQMDGRTLICAREGSTQPRQIIAIDVGGGAERVVFDPNPEFAEIRLGSVERLHWTNTYGIPSFGDLVLPPGFQPGQGKIPLIVVQYRTRGFLRGGTGDEYPIQLFAARGYAVLSVEMPPTYYSREPDGPWHTWQEAELENTRDLHERKNILSSLVTGVEAVVARGYVDPARIGVTGLSDGSTNVQFALTNTRLFAAASLSSGGTDSQSMVYGGPALIEVRKREGWPAAGSANADYWKASSLAFKTDGPRVPLLMQLADHEMLLGLEVYTTLRERHWPVELYTFPDEYHLKSQPAHRAAIYQRNLAWFDFWLKGQESANPTQGAELARWKRLRAEAADAASSPAKAVTANP